MKWKFWQKEPQPVETGDCKHDWTHWPDPIEATAKVYSMFGTDGAERECLAQSRRCLKCNMHERRYC